MKEEYENKPPPSRAEPKPSVEQQVTKDTHNVKKSKNVALAPKDRDSLQHHQSQEDDSFESGDFKVNSTVDEACKGMQERGRDVVPPKPLPRTSRAGSMCDQPTEEAVIQPTPVARPRTNSCAPVITSVNPYVPIAGGYKVPV